MKSTDNFGQISYFKIGLLLFFWLIVVFGLFYEFNQHIKDIRKIIQLMCALPFLLILSIQLYKVIKAGFVYRITDGEISFRDGTNFSLDEIDGFTGYPNMMGYDVKFKINDKELNKSILFSKHSFAENVRMLNEFLN